MAGFISVMTNKMSAEHSLKVRLHRLLGGSQPARPLTRLHASEVTKPDFCPRRTAIMLQTDTRPPDEYLTTSLAVTFKIGHMLQDSITSWAADAKLAVGHWRCIDCGVRYNFCARPMKCQECGHTKMGAIEVRVRSAYSGISGGIDLLVNLGKPKLTIVEIKTMAPDEFKKLIMPLAEHRVRTSLYMRLAAEDAGEFAQRVDTNTALILYASKGGFGTADNSLVEAGLKEKFSPFKEYVIQRDDTLSDAAVERATELTRWRQDEGPMPGRICASPSSPYAQVCPVRAYCFGKLYPVDGDLA